MLVVGASCNELRQSLVLRRKIHKIFDELKCREWNELLEFNGLERFKFLVLKDCYISFELLINPNLLWQKLCEIHDFLTDHL
jgi:hypothetical protein